MSDANTEAFDPEPDLPDLDDTETDRGFDDAGDLPNDDTTAAGGEAGAGSRPDGGDPGSTDTAQGADPMTESTDGGLAGGDPGVEE